MINKELIEMIQSRIEALYGIRLGIDANEYLITENELAALLPAHQHTAIPKELFLVNPEPQDETVEVALFLDDTLKKNLSTHNPLERLTNDNISDFCLLIEGISHFVYYLHKANLEFEITQLELELQAEIDKFLLLALLTTGSGLPNNHLLDLLFENYCLQNDLSEENAERYETANSLAKKYCYTLSSYIKKNRYDTLFEELRYFYPLSQEDKIRHILY
ncbi:MAG: hypothetical protein ABII18_11440 [bacterium]|nr:hypothetical protein [bacterium]MBU1918639.1 hypothetical protein [bacterium]